MNSNRINYKGVEYIIDNDNRCAQVVGFKSESVELPISFEYSGLTYRVSSIPSYVIPTDSLKCFAINGVKEIRIEGDDLEICDHAFYKIRSLQKVIIEGSINRIGDAAFAHCVNLKDITINGSVDTFGQNVCLGCTHLVRAHLGNITQEMGKQMFKDCNALREITLPEGISKIPEATFIRCYSLEQIDIPRSVSLIGRYAVLDCTSLFDVSYDIEKTQLEYGCFNRTPFDPTWRTFHPLTLHQKQKYGQLLEIQSNLRNGIILSDHLSIYNKDGDIVSGDRLFHVIKGFTNGRSVHFPFSSELLSKLEYSTYEDRVVYYYPVGNVLRRLYSINYIRLVENGIPLNEYERKYLLESGIPIDYIDNPILGMEAFINKNPDIPVVLAEALRGLGLNITADRIKELATVPIKVPPSILQYERNRDGNNFLVRIGECISSLYSGIDKLYKSRGHVSAFEFFEVRVSDYVYLINMINYHSISRSLIEED